MSRTTVLRTVNASPAQVLNLILDFERYSSFVPGVRRVRVKPVPSTRCPEAAEVEALLKNSKFSGTLRVHVEMDRPAGRILVNHRFGPFKTLAIGFNVAALSSQSTEIRCDVDAVSAMPAVNAILVEHLKVAAVAYADVFERELSKIAPAPG